jgi:hypothetical protein
MLQGLFDVLVAHRDAALAGLGRVPTSPRTLAAAERLVSVTRAGGLSDRVIALGLDLVGGDRPSRLASKRQTEPALKRP